MKKWFEFLKEDVSKEYELKVLASAEKELLRNQSSSRLWGRWAFLAGMSSLALSALVYFRFFNDPSDESSKKQLADSQFKKDSLTGENDFSDDMLFDEDLVENLEFFADLELIEELDEDEGDFEI